eukprot:GHVQ01009181.1.p1 GENE.GHVQ01009181.1~~GHVQ01009181.1.p1  ORF type:complete len:261 (-),score=60.44 GHVQ01009181.1:3144-3926(-)
MTSVSVATQIARRAMNVLAPVGSRLSACSTVGCPMLQRGTVAAVAGNQRLFSSGGGGGGGTPEHKLLQVIQGEIGHETQSYEAPSNIDEFLKKSEWKLQEKSGDVNMTLTRDYNGKKVVVEFQLVSPFEGEENTATEEGQQAGETAASQSEMTDFTVSVVKKDGSGVTFFCSTLQNDESFRYMIGNVRQFRNEEERNAVSGYNGPEFEDLDDKLQEALDEWLESLGVNSEMCDFIDAVAVDKEQKEYMHWLKSCASVLEK